MMALLDSSGKAPFTQERSHDLQGSHTTDSYLLQWKRHVSFLPNVSEMCWWHWIKYQSAKKVLSTVCIESCRPNSKSNRYFFTFPTVAFFLSGTDLNITDVVVCLFSAGRESARPKTQTGRHSLTSQVIQNSSKISKTHSHAHWRKAYQLGQSITRTPTWLWSEVDHQHNMQPLSVRSAAASITWAPAKPNMRIQNTIKLRFVFQLNWAHFPVCAARRWVRGSGWVCWVTTCLWSSMPSWSA